MTGQAVHEPPVRWTLSALSVGEDRVEEQARTEALELAKGLAAQAVALADDAGADEYLDRLGTLSRTIWPKEPLEGYALQSSLGTFLVARVAVGWTPPTKADLLDAPLDVAGLRAELLEHGLPPGMVAAMFGQWKGPQEDFTPDPEGVSAALLAGLAEQTLSRTERNAALSQVAWSPRCLARLVTTCEALDGVRKVLAVIPLDDEELGPDYITAVAALALGRPDRALALLGEEPSGRPHSALAEIAMAQWSLSEGQPASFEEDDSLPIVPLDADAPEPVEEGDEDDDGDGILEFHEEIVGSETSDIEASAKRLPEPARWSRPGWNAIELDETFIKLWRDGRVHRRSIFAQLGSLLGLRPQTHSSTHRIKAVPPDDRTIRRILDERSEPTDASTAQTERIDITAFVKDQQEKLGLSSTEPLFPTLRAALRAVASAAEGHPPSQDAISEAGDLAWALQRARVIGLVTNGDHDSARGAIHTYQDTVARESRWAEARLARFMGRDAEPLEPVLARQAAAKVVLDLGVQLGRTIAGSAL